MHFPGGKPFMVWRVEGEINLIVTKQGKGALFFEGREGFRKFKMAAAYDAATCFLCFSSQKY
jgi:hypothetical protein